MGRQRKWRQKNPEPIVPSVEGMEEEGLRPIPARAAHRSPIQPALQRVHLPVT